MSRPIIPTNPAEEQAKGRVALWLDPDDLRWLAQFCSCPENGYQTDNERCARIRFRAHAALHKAGMVWHSEVEISDT